MKRLLLAVNLLLASCAPQLSLAQRTPALKLTTADSIVAYGQPPIYFTWWQELASCENLDLPFPLIGRVQFGPWHVAEFFDRCGLAPWGP
jgi:hypothetical protein